MKINFRLRGWLHQPRSEGESRDEPAEAGAQNFILSEASEIKGLQIVRNVR